MSYQYKMIQVPPVISIKTKNPQGGEAAVYLEEIVKQHAQSDWEFYRVDSIGVRTEPGCLGALLGHTAQTLEHYVITFRKGN